MQPIDKLLARVKWDKAFGNAAFEIGYYDRMAALTVRRPLADLLFEPGNMESFLLMDEEGVYQRSPAPGARGVPQRRADLASAGAGGRARGMNPGMPPPSSDRITICLTLGTSTAYCQREAVVIGRPATGCGTTFRFAPTSPLPWLPGFGSKLKTFGTES